MEIKIPEFSLVLLIGASSSGKSTFAKKYFKPYEVISSDSCRAIVSNDENNQSATKDAFELLHYTLSKRLKNGLLTVVDATNVQFESRKKLIEIARQYHALTVAIVFAIPEKVCKARNAARTDRVLGDYVIRMQTQQLKRSIRGLKKERYANLYTFRSPEEVDQITAIHREKLYNNKKEITGPFDIIGDIHGCFSETIELLEKLGYLVAQVAEDSTNYGIKVFHPENRQVIFLGDLVDRGPDSPAVLKLAMSMVKDGIALCVPGNHDVKLHKKLSGKNVKLKHGLAETMEQLDGETPEFLEAVKGFIDSLISHLVLDDGRLVVAHAGLKEDMQGRGSGAVRSFCLYGETTGEIDEFGLPVRLNWAADYRGKAKVVYGHTPVPEAEWLNNTIDIDTGCVFGGKLTALRYPEMELVEVAAKEAYCVPVKPLNPIDASGLSQQQVYDDVLDISDLLGKQIIHTRLRQSVIIREENGIAALEVMSRFAVNPKWLIYLPPTMSPCGTSNLPEYLEHPHEAINYYKSRGIQQLICEEKHMGSRAVLVICKDEAAVAKRFGIRGEGIGICYTRTGRNFFTDQRLEKIFLNRVNEALTATDFWTKHQTDWVCLDAELMPWSAKAQALLQTQYAAVGTSALNALTATQKVLATTLSRGLEGVDDLVNQYGKRKELITKYTQAYRNYCWEVNSIDDYKLAPFHILATEGQVHVDKKHTWHMEQIAAICKGDPKLLQATHFKVIDTQDEESVSAAVNWWLALTENGGEGMVVKPLEFIAKGEEGILQPAVKCRGKEYLRIIYGPEYDLPKNLKRLKKRGLSRKRSLALRAFSLGVEALERFVKKDPLRKVHQCVFGVLALESEEVDPRL